jgi:hypothetical protein
MTINSAALARFIDGHFEVVRNRSSGDEMFFVCPICGDATGNRAVNLKTGLTNCWRCKEKQPGHILSWLRSVGYEVNQDDIGTSLGNQDIGAAVRQALSGTEGYRKRGAAACSLPKGFTTVWDAVEQRRHKGACNLVSMMAADKNLSLDDMAEMGVGFVPLRTGDPDWYLYAIFPVILHGYAVYFQGRDLLDGSKKFPSRDVAGSGCADWVYNLDELRDSSVRKAVIVESVLNVISLRKKLREQKIQDVVPVATFSAALSQRQRKMVFGMKHLAEVTIFFDHDATDKAWRFAEECFRYARSGVSVTVAEMPSVCGPKSDPNDDMDAAFEAWQRRAVFDPMTQGMRKITQALRCNTK